VHQSAPQPNCRSSSGLGHVAQKVARGEEESGASLLYKSKSRKLKLHFELPIVKKFHNNSGVLICTKLLVYNKNKTLVFVLGYQTMVSMS